MEFESAMENVSASENNTSYPCDLPPFFPPHLEIPSAVNYLQVCTALVLGTIGFLLNLYILIVIVRYRSLHQQLMYLALQIVGVDLLYTITIPPVIFLSGMSGEWLLGGVMCNIFGMIHDFFAMFRFTMTLVLTLDRFISVFWPYFYLRNSIRLIGVLLVVTYTVSILRGLLPVTGILSCFVFVPTQKTCTAFSGCSDGCFWTVVFSTSIVVVFGALIPLVLYIILFCKTRAIKRHSFRPVIGSIATTTTSSAMRTIVKAGFESKAFKEGEEGEEGEKEEKEEEEKEVDSMGFKICSKQQSPVVANRINTELETGGENVGSNILQLLQCSDEVSGGPNCVESGSNVMVDSNATGTEMAGSNTDTDSDVTETKMTDSDCDELETNWEQEFESHVEKNPLPGLQPDTKHSTEHKELESDFKADNLKSRSLPLEELVLKDVEHSNNRDLESNFGTVHKIPLELNSIELKSLELKLNYRSGNRSRIISVESESDYRGRNRNRFMSLDSDYRDGNRSRVMSLESEPDKKRSALQSNVRTNITMFILLMSVIGCTAPAFVLYGIQFLYLEPEPVLFIINMLVGRTFFNLLPVIDGIAIMRHREFRIASSRFSKVIRGELFWA